MGIGIDKVKKALYSICDVLQEEKEELTEIDSRLGDGDMGISMDKGSQRGAGCLSGDGYFKTAFILRGCIQQGCAFHVRYAVKLQHAGCGKGGGRETGA